MPRESRSASVKAASASAYGYMRAPPQEGPSAVECTAMIAFRPDFLSLKCATASCESKSGELKTFTRDLFASSELDDDPVFTDKRFLQASSGNGLAIWMGGPQ